MLLITRTRTQVPHTAEPNHPATHDAIDELMHVDHYNEHVQTHGSKRDLWVAGVVIAFAIALHNIPEGMSIGASYNVDLGSVGSAALVLAILIGLHNIPEGMAVAVPLIAGGMSRPRAVILTACSGLPLVLGALLGFWLGDIGPAGAFCLFGFCFRRHALCCLRRDLPQAILMYRSKMPAFFLIAGMLIGVIIINF